MSVEEKGSREQQSKTEESRDTRAAYESVHLTGLYKNWFLDYASYVILERAVPEILDGLKPVQRRILHAMRLMDDGRFNKVANIIGSTMQFHPHGDASIGDALVQLGQKELLIDMQGNWGNIFTGDGAAAPRYIEARLTKFALEVVFNPKTTPWKLSYDGRNKEPLYLPVKFPLLLALGTEGIAVGLASKILPHNFNELIDASIEYLKGKDFELFPDFATGGLIDVSRYQDGIRGGKIRARARITAIDKKTLVIKEIPFSTTTPSLIDSIVAANEKGKIKIRKIDDNTAEDVEIVISLASQVSPDQTIDALYAFTQCEVSVSPNACLIIDNKPHFVGVSEILRKSTDQTLSLLKQELEIRMAELEEDWHMSSLEKIFIQNRLYLNIEACESWEEVLQTIGQDLKPYEKMLKREVSEDDLIKLTEIRIKRISRYNTFKADEHIQSLEDEMEEVRNHLGHLIDYAINYFRQIKKKYGKDKNRKTEIRSFDNIDVSRVAAVNERLYLNREEGFAGTALKKDEFISECSDLDDIIVFRADGSFMVTKIAQKVFVGKEVIHLAVFKKNDERTIYNAIYRNGKKGYYYAKRFAVTSITRDKEYTLSQGEEGSRLVYFTVNPNGEAEVVKVNIKPKPRLKKLSFEFDFSTLAIKNRSSKGNLLSKIPLRNISKKEEGVSTLGAIDIYYDDSVRRLNTDKRGRLIGSFRSDDRILVLTADGHFRLTSYDLSSHFEDEMIELRKHHAEEVLSVVYQDGSHDKTYLKRFAIPSNFPGDKKTNFIGDHKESKLIAYSIDRRPVLKLSFKKNKKGEYPPEQHIDVSEFIAVKSLKARGKRLSNQEIKAVEWLEPLEGPLQPETAAGPETPEETPQNSKADEPKHEQGSGKSQLDLFGE